MKMPCLKRSLLAMAGLAIVLVGLPPSVAAQRRAARRLPVDLEAIVDVDGDAAGRLYVIEDRRNRLLVLDSTFAIMAEVPNDPSDSATVVMAQRAIRVLDRGRFVRLERYLRRLDVFEWRGRKVAKVRATRFPFELWDACHAGGDTLVVVGPYRGMRLHTVLMTGQILKSFAPVDSALPTRLADWHTGGYVACSKQHGAVMYQSSSQPFLEAFDRRSGTRDFRGNFPLSHRAVSASYERAKGMMTVSSGPEGIHAPRRPELVGDTLEVQARLTAMGTWRDTVLVHRFARTDGKYLGTRIERQLRFALSDGRRLIVSLDGSERTFIVPAQRAPVTR
jgi:hypothetical protein